MYYLKRNHFSYIPGIPVRRVAAGVPRVPQREEEIHQDAARCFAHHGQFKAIQTFLKLI